MKQLLSPALVFLLIALVFSFLVSCDMTQSADEIEAHRQEAVQKEGQAQAGLPGITRFQEKKDLKMIYELRDQENLVCYAYLFNEFNGKLIFIGKCIGYGIPYATQYSNPSKVEYNHSAYITLPQSEPNGLFMPAAAEGTWVMLIDPKEGKPHPVYIEPRVIVSPFPLPTN